MRTGKLQIMMGKNKKPNFNDIIGNNSKRFNPKNMRRLEEMNIIKCQNQLI